MGSFDWRTAADALNFSSLPLIDRLFLTCDGTLTDIIEAAFLEPIKLTKLSVTSSLTSAPIEELDLKSGEPVMRREILLQGENSQTTYMYAETVVALDGLPATLREQLANTDIPIGRLMMQHKLETRKELLKIWRVPTTDVSLFFGSEKQGGLIARTFRVFSGGRPIMLISEYFPVAL